MESFTANLTLPPYLPYPKFLLGFPVSETAKLMYAMLLGRFPLSRKNGWVDPDGRVYCRYPIKALCQDAHRGHTTVQNALGELEKAGLLERRRLGVGCANKLYLRYPESCMSDVPKTGRQLSGKPDTSKINRNKINNINYLPDYTYTGDSL